MDPIIITNFGGRLTRIINGEMNSGFAKFANSFGYDPFSKPGNLTWLEGATEITGPITGLPLVGKTTANSGVTNAETFVLDSNGKFYAIQGSSNTNANVDSVIGISSITAGNTYNFGASMDFYALQSSALGVYVGGDLGVNSATFSGTNDKAVGTSGNYVQSRYRPLKTFIGSLFFGNGNTVGHIDSTGTVTSSVQALVSQTGYSDLNPPIPPSFFIKDLDLTVDGNYMLITAAEQKDFNITGLEGNYYNLSVNSALFKWNGTDTAITALTNLPGISATSLQTYLNTNMFFAEDAFGSAVLDESTKYLTLQGVKPASPNATCNNGNFLTWAAVENIVANNNSYVSLFYFGSLDQENPPGLYRIMRYAGGSLTGYVFQVPMNLLVANNFTGVNTSFSSIMTYGYGKHYIGAGAITSGSAKTYVLLRFNVNSTGSGTPQSGVYETQTQLFSKKVVAKQMRVYTEPTASGNGFQIDLIGSDGTILANGTKTYTFASGTDVTKLQGALQRIDFNFTAAPTYAMAVRISNTGTTNMTIKKIELDMAEEGK